MKLIIPLIFMFLLIGCLPQEQIIEEPVIEQPKVEIIPEETIDQLHWPELPVKFQILNEEVCGSYQSNKIKRAFQNIENATNNVIQFEQVNEQADIEISCSFLEDCYEKTIDIEKVGGVIHTTKYETICPYNRGVARTKTRGNIIESAHIEFVGLAGFAETTGRGASGFYIGSCGHENVEMHEILHTFGYSHKDDPNSIMAAKEDGVGYTLHKEDECKGSRKSVDKEIVAELVEVYG